MGLSGARRSARSVHPRLGAPNRKKRIRSGRPRIHVRQVVLTAGCHGRPLRTPAQQLDPRRFSGPKMPAEGVVSSLKMAGLAPIFLLREAVDEIRWISFPQTGEQSACNVARIAYIPLPQPDAVAAGRSFIQTAGSPHPSISLGFVPSVLGQAKDLEPQRLRRHLQGEVLSFGFSTSLISRSDLGLHRLLWQHSG